MKTLLRLLLLLATALPAMANRDHETGVFLSRDPIGNELMDPADVWVVNGQKFEAKPSGMSDPMMLVAVMNSRNYSSNPTKSAQDEKRSQHAAVMRAQYGSNGEGLGDARGEARATQPLYLRQPEPLDNA